MSRFEDQLFEEIMLRHGDELAGSRQVRNRRPALAAGVLAAVGAGAVGIAVGGVSAPAYAVTQHPDGTVTVTLKDVAAAAQTNAELTRRGLPIRVQPILPDCPNTVEYQADLAAPGIDFSYQDTVDAITIPTTGVPPGDLAVITVLTDGNGQIEVMTIGGPPAKGYVAPCLRGDEASMGIYHGTPGTMSAAPSDESTPPTISESSAESTVR
jgi:hypothetical protein